MVTLELGYLTDPKARCLHVSLLCFFIIFYYILLNFSNLFYDTVINSRLFNAEWIVDQLVNWKGCGRKQ
jgi:hypothetical protein